MPRGIGGEIAWWCPSLDDSGNGTTTLNDLTGNGNTGTLTNMDASTDWVADTTSGGVRALDFDGSNDHVTGSGLASISGATSSVSVWVKFDTLTGVGDVLLTIGTGQRFWQIANATQVYVSSALATVSSQTWVGAWTHIALIADGTTTAAYRDGTLISTSGSTPTAIASGTKAFRIADWTAGGFAFDGLLDDMRVFARVLSQAEITKLASKRGYQKPAAAAATLFFFQGF